METVDDEDSEEDIPVVSALPTSVVEKAALSRLSNCVDAMKGWKKHDSDLLFLDLLAVGLQGEAKNGLLDEFLLTINHFREGAWDMRMRYVDIVSEALKIEPSSFDWNALVQKLQHV
jgi:hypothetical protein